MEQIEKPKRLRIARLIRRSPQDILDDKAGEIAFLPGIDKARLFYLSMASPINTSKKFQTDVSTSAYDQKRKLRRTLRIYHRRQLLAAEAAKLESAAY